VSFCVDTEKEPETVPASRAPIARDGNTFRLLADSLTDTPRWSMPIRKSPDDGKLASESLCNEFAYAAGRLEG